MDSVVYQVSLLCDSPDLLDHPVPFPLPDPRDLLVYPQGLPDPQGHPEVTVLQAAAVRLDLLDPPTSSAPPDQTMVSRGDRSCSEPTISKSVYQKVSFITMI